MSSISDGFRDVFLAGVGAMALGAEKSKELVDQLIAKGEITVEQGKQINSALVKKATEAGASVRDDMLAAHMRTMTKDERDAFAAKIAEMAAAVDEKEAAMASEAEEVEAQVAEDGADAVAAEDAAAEDDVIADAAVEAVEDAVSETETPAAQ